MILALFIGALSACSNDDAERDYLNNGPEPERVTDHSNDIPTDDEILQSN